MLQGSVKSAVDEQAQRVVGVTADAPRAPLPASESAAPRAGRRIAFALAALCLLTALAAPDALFDIDQFTLIWPPDLRAWSDWVLQLHWLLGLLVIVPFAIMALIIFDLSARTGRRFTLVPRDPWMIRAPGPHTECCRALWQDECVAIKTLWDYEKERISRLQCRLVLQALLFGNITTFAFMCCVLATSAGGTAKAIACSLAAAAATGFLTSVARILLRISGGDITTRTLSWAIRSQVLVIVADVGLCMLLANEVQSIERALALGIFVGATGDHAIQFMIDKASKVFNTGTVAVERASPLLDIEGVTDDHVERLAEEGIASIHDFAFVPTARLFLATTYSLPQICNWQDRALLRVWVGKSTAETLGQTMNIRGAIDLMMLAHDLAFGKRTDADACTAALAKALQIEPAAMAAVLPTIAHDENAIRIRSYATSTVASTEGSAQPLAELRIRPRVQLYPEAAAGSARPVSPAAAPPSNPAIGVGHAAPEIISMGELEAPSRNPTGSTPPMPRDT